LPNDGAVTLDFSKSQPLTLDFSKSQQIEGQQGAPDEGWWQKTVSDPINSFLTKHGVPTYGGPDEISKHITSAADKINKGMASSQFQAATGMLGGSLGTTATNAADQVIPSVARAGQHFQELSNFIGKHTVEMTDTLSDAIQDASQLAKSGGQMPKTLSDLIGRLFETNEGPLTYDEARRFMTTTGRKLADMMDVNSQRVKDPEMVKAMGNVYSELRGAVESTANKAGQLAKFTNAMAEYKNALKVRGAVSTAAKAAAIPAAGAAISSPIGHAAVGTLREMLGY
jgi:hypothetical protein